MKKAKVTFLPQNIELEIDPDESVMELAHRNNVFIKSVCNGLPSCAECRVKLVEGDHNVMPPFEKELGLIGTGHFVDQRRLSCQLHCYGDITVDLTEQIEKEQAGPRRPQGSQKTETDESYAVTGNLIQQAQDEMEEVAGKTDSKSDDRPVKDASTDFYKELSSPQSKDGSGKSGDKNKKRSGNRNRNRNRNRNKKRTGGKYRPK